MALSLSNPQNIFLNGLDTKYRAYVGGFGCVHPDTRIWTEHGLMRISEIDRPMRVLSWNEKDQQFQLSLSGGAFPKGKANLYRVSTQRGEFRATGHHRSFSSDRKYLRVDELEKGGALKTCEQSLLRSIEADGLLWLPSGDQHCSEINANLMGRYADEARQYGLQLLEAGESDQASPPSQSGAHRSTHSFDFSSASRMGDQEERIPERTHPDQSCDQRHMKGCVRPLVALEEDEARCASALLTERISHFLALIPLSLLRFVSRRSTVKHSIGAQGQTPLQACYYSSVDDSSILTVSDAERDNVYYDMQVLDTNNYVDEFGHIHHNSGKTFVGCLDLLIFAGKYPKLTQGYFGPTYPAIRDIFYPTLEEAAHMMGFSIKVNTSDKEVHLYRNGSYYGSIICRSMDNPDSIVGFKIARALVDEIDTLKKEKADNAWNKIIARMRLVVDGVVNSIGVTTTPEGFKFVYSKFADNPTESYSMVQASTYENEEYLPPDYIRTLIETYPEQLIQAYLRGMFVNLLSGTVYRSYDRLKHRSDETHRPGEPILIGMDFNIDKMAATGYVIRDKAFHAVYQITDGYNTPTVAQMIKERFPNEKVIIFPDSSGKNRTRMGGASESDIAILQNDFKFECRFKKTNPPVKDRVNATNAAFEHGRLFVNDKLCPDVAACFEQQTYDKNGEPDKTSGKDHQNDASTYPIAYEMPIIRPVTNIRAGMMI